MGPGQCAGPEQMCPGTTGAPICETNWPTIEKLEQLQQALRREGQLAVASPSPGEPRGTGQGSLSQELSQVPWRGAGWESDGLKLGHLLPKTHPGPTAQLPNTACSAGINFKGQRLAPGPTGFLELSLGVGG